MGCGARGLRLVTSRSGGSGAPLAGTTTGRQELADCGELEKPAGSAARNRKKPQTERREAPSPDRTGEGDASQASRAIAPIAQEADRKASVFSGAPLPSLFGNADLQFTADPAPVKHYGR